MAESEILHLLDNIIDSETINFESNYYFNNRKVPRVTHILSRCIHNDGLMYWANSLGFKRQSYSKTLKQAADIGSQCHESIDTFLNGNAITEPFNIMAEASNAYQSFLRWYNDVSSCAEIKNIFHEKSLVCKYFGGTLDGLYQINGKTYIVDYKTSNHITYNYCLQLAAYIFMLETIENITVDGCIILQLSKYDISYNEFSLDFSNESDKKFIEECREAFLSMTLWFYHLSHIDFEYSKLNWR